MKRTILLLLLALVSSWATANDGVFYAAGNTLIPIKETLVELEKEILRLTRDGEYMIVDVDFTFNNPGGEKEVIVGFVTPPAAGDVDYELMAHPQVFDFVTKIDGESIPFKVATLDKTGFKLDKGVAYGEDFVYHFPVTFKPGKTRIQHRYRYRGGSSVEMLAEFEYRITTGKMWANGEIGDFTLEIDMGDGSYYSIPTTFFDEDKHEGEEGSLETPWKAQDLSILSDPMKNFFNSEVRMVKQYGGGVSLHMTHFKPDYDIMVGEYQLFNEVYLWTADRADNPFLDEPYFLSPGYAEESELYELEKEGLSMLRNYFFAKYGYAFKSQKLQETFGKFIWYKAIPGKKIILPEAEQDYIDLLKKVENNL